MCDFGITGSSICAKQCLGPIRNWLTGSIISDYLFLENMTTLTLDICRVVGSRFSLFPPGPFGSHVVRIWCWTDSPVYLQHGVSSWNDDMGEVSGPEVSFVSESLGPDRMRHACGINFAGHRTTLYGFSINCRGKFNMLIYLNYNCTQ